MARAARQRWRSPLRRHWRAIHRQRYPGATAPLPPGQRCAGCGRLMRAQRAGHLFQPAPTALASPLARPASNKPTTKPGSNSARCAVLMAALSTRPCSCSAPGLHYSPRCDHPAGLCGDFTLGGMCLCGAVHYAVADELVMAPSFMSPWVRSSTIRPFARANISSSAPKRGGSKSQMSCPNSKSML